MDNINDSHIVNNLSDKKGLTLLISVLSIQFSIGNTFSETKIDYSNLEATNLEFVNFKTIYSGPATHLAWSPDSRRIAFHSNGRIWIINRDGTGAVPISAGECPAWSKDGKKLFFLQPGRVTVRDLVSKQENALLTFSGIPYGGLYLSKDGQYLFLRSSQHPERYSKINLDDLSESSTDEEVNNEVQNGFFHPSFNLICHSNFAPFSNNVNYTDGSLQPLGDVFAGSFYGLWVTSKDWRYKIRLSGRECINDSLAYAPDFSHVAFAPIFRDDGKWNPRNISIVIGQIKKRLHPWNLKYEFSGNEVASESIEEIANGLHYIVYGKKVNPLNNKIIGPDTKNVKGALQAIKIGFKTTLLELVEWNGKKLLADDVIISEYNRVNNLFASGDQVDDRAFLLGNPLSSKELERWEGTVPQDNTAKEVPETNEATIATDVPSAPTTNQQNELKPEERDTRINLSSLRSAAILYFSDKQTYPKDLTELTLVNGRTRYIAAIPLAKTLHHPPSNAFTIYTGDFPKESNDTGGWAYWIREGQEPWIKVDCTHMDSQGYVWHQQ